MINQYLAKITAISVYTGTLFTHAACVIDSLCACVRICVCAEHWAFVAEHQGRGGSLIKEFCLLQKSLSKPASSVLVAKDGGTLQSDGDKLNCWVKHFQEVVNCQADIDVTPSPSCYLPPFQTRLFQTVTYPSPSLRRAEVLPLS